MQPRRMEKKPLRLVYLCCYAAIILAAALWMRQPPTPSPAPTSANGRSTRDAGAATSPDRVPPTINARAASTIRSTNVGATTHAPGSPSSATSARSPVGKAPSSAAASTSATQDSDTDLKPASELFSMFVEDDPSQVFLSSTVQYHAALKSESVDPAWAPDATHAIRDYLASRYGERFEIASLDCRTDLCELQLAARKKGDVDTDMRDMQQAVAQMKQEPWWSALAFDQESTAVGGSPDGRALLLWFCSRK